MRVAWWQAANDDTDLDLARALRASMSTSGAGAGGGAAPHGVSAEEASLQAAMEASLRAQHAPPPQAQRGPPMVGQAQSASMESLADLDPADVFRHCMSGSVEEVRRFLQQGGHADTVYKSAYGWDVGPDWLFTKPNDGTTVLNYVATWTDVIGPPAAQLVDLLIEHGADPRRDDGLDMWFTPLHNAVANGATDVATRLLARRPDLVDIPTGDGRRPLHVLALCDDAADRMTTLGLLLRHNAPLEHAEPFQGDTALHVYAREGHMDLAATLLAVGAPRTAKNEAGRTPFEEAEHELAGLDTQAEAASGTRRARLQQTMEAFLS